MRKCLDRARSTLQRYEQHENKFDLAAKIVMASYSGKVGMEVEKGHGVVVLQKFMRWALQQRYYSEVAWFLWGHEMFQIDAGSTKRVFEQLDRKHRVALMGAGAMGKSYTVIVWLACDFLADPEYTTIKIISSTASSADANARSTLVRLWKESIIPLPGVVQSNYIGLDPKERRFGIERISIPAGDDAKGRLRGKCHPFPRSKTHPIFGTHSRSRVFLDEDETIPNGVWEEVKNVCSGMDDKGSIKVFRANNPKDPASKSAQLNEPRGGWHSFQIDTDIEWESREGWLVIRLDGARCENVIEKRIIFPGLLTYDGYFQYLRRDPPGPEYFTMARGAYPPQGTVGSLVPEAWLADWVGDFIFSGVTENIGGCDIALEGDDDCCFALGRMGKAIGFINRNKVRVMLPTPILGIQLDQIVKFPKGDTIAQAKRIMNLADQFGVKPGRLSLDRTGNGAGVFSYMRTYWKKGNTVIGEDLIGCDFGSGATEFTMMEEDLAKCSEQYNGLHTELAFGCRRFIEHGLARRSASVNGGEGLEKQMIQREYRLVGKARLAVESKRDFKERTKDKSPDEMDAYSLMLFSARRQTNFKAGMVAVEPTDPETEELPEHDSMDILDFVDVTGER